MKRMSVVIETCLWGEQYLKKVIHWNTINLKLLPWRDAGYFLKFFFSLCPSSVDSFSIPLKNNTFFGNLCTYLPDHVESSGRVSWLSRINFTFPNTTIILKNLNEIHVVIGRNLRVVFQRESYSSIWSAHLANWNPWETLRVFPLHQY